MRLRGAAVAAGSTLVAACLSTPPFRGPEVTALVGYSEDGNGGGTITAPSFALHFAGGNGFHFPDQLVIDHVDVMGHATTPCWGQSGTGISVVPMPRISGDPVTGGLPAMTSQLDAKLRGPAVAQVQLAWSTRWSFDARPMCSPDTMHIPGGSSTFTVFPDGHIARHDHLTDANPHLEQVTANDCTCPDPPIVGGEFILSSYWAFDSARFPDQLGLGRTGPDRPDPLELMPGKIVANYGTICLDAPASKYQLTSVWMVPPATPSGPAQLAAAFGYAGLMSLDVQKAGDHELDFPWDIHGVLFYDQSTCPRALSRAMAYAAPPPLTITHGATTAQLEISPIDGMYGGDPGDGKAPGFEASSGPLTLSGSLPGSFAVWLRFPPASVPGVPLVTRQGATGEWYVPQRVDDQNWIVWFRDPLKDGETIAIRPN